MDAPSGEDWKNKVGFPINYNSGSSDDDFDTKDVVFRNPRYSSKFLLQDCGDGSEADLLGSTPPRSRIRDKEKGRRMFIDTPNTQRLSQKREAADYANYDISPASERLKKRSSLKLIRTRARDSKQDIHEPRADSLPSPNPMAAVPTLVDTSSRFMSLTSRPKHRTERQETADPEERWRCDGDEELPPSRVIFHKTFSLLINMGNIEKGCKRAISREEQVWQNELKDLIWLELQAKLAGRTLAQQDAYLCTQRNIVPKIIEDILHYKFVNTTPCKNLVKQFANVDSSEELTAQHIKDANISEEEIMYGCLSFDCKWCADAIGRAMREVGLLLDSFHNALSLYPSSRNMTLDHPQVATTHFENRMKAMCLWYNTSLHIRLIMVTMRRMLRTIRRRTMKVQKQHAPAETVCKEGEESPCIIGSILRCYQRQRKRYLGHSANPHYYFDPPDDEVARPRETEVRPCQVRFELSSSESDSAESADGEQEEDEEEEEDGADDIDSASVSTYGPQTPPVLVPDAAGDAHTSAESGYVSEGAAADAFSLGELADFTQMRLLHKCHVSFYREYHREILKTMGVRRCMMFINKMREELLNKVCDTLKKPESADLDSIEEEDVSGHVFEDAAETTRPRNERTENEMKLYELRRYGCWSEEYLQMRLPSYRSHFLLLSGICMEAVHDYLSFRLESRPDHPSCLTVKQLIHELREGLDISSEMRAQWTRHIRAAGASVCLGAPGGAGAGGCPGGARVAPRADTSHLALLTRTFDETVETLFKQYLSYLTTMSETEHLSRGCLQTEWDFTAKLARRISCASVLAPTAFSDITCNQLKRLLDKFQKDFNIEEGEDKDSESDKMQVYVEIRDAQSWYLRSRDAALQAAQWARALAARLARAPPPAYLLQRTHMFNCLMSIRDVIVEHCVYIMERSRTLHQDAGKDHDTILVRVRELLMQIYKLGFELHKELYKFVHTNKWHDDICKRRGRPISLPTRSPLVERRRRPETMIIHESYNTMIHRELHRFGNSPAPRPPAPPPRRARLARSTSIVPEYENSVFDDALYDNANNLGDNQNQSIELGPTLEPSDEEVEVRKSRSVSSEEKQWAARVARGVIEFARCWMQFVVDRCDRGRGLRPRWASQGLEFLMLACDPRNTKHLSEEEFEELKQLMDGCISHVVGTRPPAAPAPPAPSPRPRHRLPSPFSNASREILTPPTPPPDADPLSYPEVGGTALKRRVIESTSRVDRQRDDRLRAAKSVGRVLEAAVSCYEPRLRQLTFKWQRGLKIGAGTFGKVYTVVNTESGQLLAMKELQVGAGDRRAIQLAANELRVLEGVLHPHLVRYYGIELHREEMLIFMELCVEGSLEALVATSGGLQEHAVRQYSKQLVSAVAELHSRMIAHRDIKSGNIFLTNEGHCLKLGDFGCAVKIRAHSTAPGELQGYVGTQAYMAPEVFMKTSGHGRAADIWSLGCVVTEMASGKRPFHQYDSNYQIMFLVGSGGRPEVPAALSDEGQDFCMSCLTHDPDLRPRAEALTLHHFLMVKDDCHCEPAYLITNTNIDK